MRDASYVKARNLIAEALGADRVDLTADDDQHADDERDQCADAVKALEREIAIERQVEHELRRQKGVR